MGDTYSDLFGEPIKPKGMHWRTFEQKVEQLKRADARALADAGAMLASIERSLGHASRALARC